MPFRFIFWSISTVLSVRPLDVTAPVQAVACVLRAASFHPNWGISVTGEGGIRIPCPDGYFDQITCRLEAGKGQCSLMLCHNWAA